MGHYVWSIHRKCDSVSIFASNDFDKSGTKHDTRYIHVLCNVNMENQEDPLSFGEGKLAQKLGRGVAVLPFPFPAASNFGLDQAGRGKPSNSSHPSRAKLPPPLNPTNPPSDGGGEEGSVSPAPQTAFALLITPK